MFADFGSAAARVSDGDGAGEADGAGGGAQAGLAQDAQKGAPDTRARIGGSARHCETGTELKYTFNIIYFKQIEMVIKCMWYFYQLNPFA